MLVAVRGGHVPPVHDGLAGTRRYWNARTKNTTALAMGAVVFFSSVMPDNDARVDRVLQ